MCVPGVCRAISCVSQESADTCQSRAQGIRAPYEPAATATKTTSTHTTALGRIMLEVASCWTRWLAPLGKVL